MKTYAVDFVTLPLNIYSIEHSVVQTGSSIEQRQRYVLSGAE